MRKIDLKTILKKCTQKKEVKYNENFLVKGVSLYSKDIKNNFIFAAIKGKSLNGENFLEDFSKLKNIAVIISSKSKLQLNLPKFQKITFIKTDDVRILISEIASIIFPNRIKNKLAITGTNGKTSVASYVNQIWNKKNLSFASVGTLGIKSNYLKSENIGLTTPDVISNHQALNKLWKKGCDNIIFEASSIGLEQKRLYPLKFDVVAFTNLSIDHMDYHTNIQNYRNSKSILFSSHIKRSSIAVINSDSKHANYFFHICKKHKIKVLDFGKKANFLKIVKIKRINDYFQVTLLLNLRQITINFECFSEFEIHNKLCAIVMVFNEKLRQEHLTYLNDLKNPEGRLEKIYDKKRIRVYIDYAHTPEALSKVLASLRKITLGKLFLVFGCGGDRDKTKRPRMTSYALKYSDKIFITNDNPRFENPNKIRDDMLKGVDEKKLKKIVSIKDRSKAIEKAIKILKPDDLLLIAGKGHENYQLIRDKKYSFSDKKIAKEFLRKI